MHVFPQPAGPVARTIPVRYQVASLSVAGSPRSTSGSTFCGMHLIARPAPRAWLWRLTRKRPSSRASMQKSTSLPGAAPPSAAHSAARSVASFSVSSPRGRRTTSPSTRTYGTAPAERCRSEALRCRASARNSSSAVTAESLSEPDGGVTAP